MADFTDVTGGSSSATVGTLPADMPSDPAQFEAAFFNAWRQLNRVAAVLAADNDPRAADAKAKADRAYLKWRSVGTMQDRYMILGGILTDLRNYPLDVLERANKAGEFVVGNLIPLAIMGALLWWLMGQQGPRRDW